MNTFNHEESSGHLNSDLAMSEEVTIPKHPFIFILGDSRTGTLSLNNFFTALGIPSIHYYEKEANQLPYNEENKEENFNRIVQYITESKCFCFSDYPTRLYYRELTSKYPDAYFILTIRRNLSTWQKSMLGFFSKFNINVDIDEVSDNYIRLNKEIREFFSLNPSLKYIEICIDDDSLMNADKIKSMINIESNISINHDNKTSNINNALLSGRYCIFNISLDVINQIESYRAGFKGMLSEFGWVFLINDSNRFMDYLYGVKVLTTSQIQKASQILLQRRDQCACKGINYFKFIIPEKSVVYAEYLPKTLHILKQSNERPALLISEACPDFVSYLADYLIDAKSYGPLYFRGDSHPNWLGSYLIYQTVIKKLESSIKNLSPPIHLASLIPSICGYDGDLFNQMSPSDSALLNNQWLDIQCSNIFEYGIKYEFPLDRRRAKAIVASDLLATVEFSREFIIKEIEDSSLPSAVIFHDSTALFMIDLLAEHFRRVVFVWHHGEVIKDIIDAEQPDVVIHFMAERFVTAYGENMVSMSSLK